MTFRTLRHIKTQLKPRSRAFFYWGWSIIKIVHSSCRHWGYSKVCDNLRRLFFRCQWVSIEFWRKNMSIIFRRGLDWHYPLGFDHIRNCKEGENGGIFQSAAAGCGKWVHKFEWDWRNKVTLRDSDLRRKTMEKKSVLLAESLYSFDKMWFLVAIDGFS